VLLVQSLPAQSLLHSDTTTYIGLDDVEITPDQHWAVVRQNSVPGYALVFDLTTGLQVGQVPTNGNLCGDVVDAVAVTNDRAVVLGGDRVAILDLTQAGTGNMLLAEQPVGNRPNDVAITPNGLFAVVRGGTTIPGSPGGQFVFDLSNGALLAQSSGAPPLYDYFGQIDYSYDTDSVAVTDQSGVVLSILGQTSANPKTRVTFWRLTQTGGPAIVLETGGSVPDIFGAPHDVAITPDGTHAVVRTEYAVVAYLLTGAVPSQLWALRPFQGPGPFEDAALDSVEVTNTRVVTISKVTNPLLPQGAQVDVIDFAGVQRWDRMPGSPHDLAITPDGTRAVVRTTEGVFLYDIATLAGQQVHPIGSALVPSSTEGYQEGFDSVAANDRIAVTLTHTANLEDTDVSFWDIAHGSLVLLARRHISGSRPIDLVITPDERKVVVSGTSSIDVFHLSTGGLAFEHHAIGPNNWYQWCDGVAATDTKAVAISQSIPATGWIDVVDMTPIHQTYCTANPNSTGDIASISALGNASVSANSLKLCVDGTPPQARGRFVYGTGQAQVPFGDGFRCVATPFYGLRVFNTNAAGAGFLGVNYLAQAIPAAIITAGSTWNFQFLYSDPASSGAGFNSSNALSITFVP
jgi:hypothetical protein